MSAMTFSVCPFLAASAGETPPEEAGRALLESMQERVDHLQNYCFHSDLETHQRNKLIKSECDFYFKKERLIRIEVASSGIRNGTVVVQDATGKVCARGGAKMLHMKMCVSPESRLLIVPNGINVLKSDLASLYKRIAHFVDSGCNLNASDVPVTISGVETDVLEVVDPNNEVLEKLFVNRDTKAPVQWEIYRDNQLFSTFKISNFKTEVSFSDELFKI